MDPFEEEANKWQSKLRALKQEELKKKLNDAAIAKARLLAAEAFNHAENDLLTGKLLSTEQLAEEAKKNKLIQKQATLQATYPNNPHCNNCGCVMVERQNKQSGDKFWGCSNYPTCTGTLRMAGYAKRKRY